MQRSGGLSAGHLNIVCIALGVSLYCTRVPHGVRFHLLVSYDVFEARR